MKILVTGANGLIGSSLVARLKDKHVVFAHEGRSSFDLLSKTDTQDMIKAFQPEVVYHLAANAAESRGQISPIDMTERNLNIFLNVLVPSINAGVKRFIYTSSVAVYGECQVPYFEDETPKPKDIYGVNKLAAEQMLKILSRVHNFDYTIFRPHNVYGPHQDMANPYKNVVALFMRNIMEDKPLKIFGEGKMKRAFSYVEDVVDVFVDALNEKYRNVTMNVGSTHEVEIIHLLELIENLSGKKANVEHLPARPQEIWNFLANHNLQRQLTTYKETPLESGLEATWNFINLPQIKEESNEIC
jgi:UDP-glucose 4-epimerase